MDKEMKELCDKEGYNFTSNWIIHPAKASYLSGSSEGHLTQILLIWLMPIFVLNLCCDRYISEFSRGYTNAILTRTSRIKYRKSKFAAAFVIPFVVFGISLLINFAASQVIFVDGYSFHGMEVFMENGGWFEFMYADPNFAYLLYLILTSTVAGLCGVICQCIAFLSRKYTLTYLISFFVWMTLIMMKYSVIYLTQPFTEYGVSYMIRSGMILSFLVVLLVIVTEMLKVKKDEL